MARWEMSQRRAVKYQLRRNPHKGLLAQQDVQDFLGAFRLHTHPSEHLLHCRHRQASAAKRRFNLFFGGKFFGLQHHGTAGPPDNFSLYFEFFLRCQFLQRGAKNFRTDAPPGFRPQIFQGHARKQRIGTLKGFDIFVNLPSYLRESRRADQHRTIVANRFNRACIRERFPGPRSLRFVPAGVRAYFLESQSQRRPLHHGLQHCLMAAIAQRFQKFNSARVLRQRPPRQRIQPLPAGAGETHPVALRASCRTFFASCPNAS